MSRDASASRNAAAASAGRPRCSRSIARTSAGMSCARAGLAASIAAQPNAHATTTRCLTFTARPVQPPEVVDHGAALLGAEPAQFLPGPPAVAVRGRPLRAAGGRREQLDPGRRRRLALRVVVALLALQRAAGVEHAPEQLLLPVPRRRREVAALERVGDALRFRGERFGTAASVGVAQLVERPRDLPLRARHRARGLPALPRLRLLHLEQARRLAVDRALLL